MTTELPLAAPETPITRDQHLIGLTTSNFMRVKLVKLAFDPANPAGLVTISGSNGEGKTSLIQSVITAITGEKIGTPLRAGAADGEVIVETEDYTVRYSMTEKGEYLTVRARANPKKVLGKPRELLDAMFTGFVDPLEFADRMTNDQRRAFLRKACPQDFDYDKNAADTKKLFDSRTEKNRDVTRLEGQQKGFTGGIPTTRPVPVDTTAVMAERARREESNRKREELIEDGKKAKQDFDQAVSTVTDKQSALKAAEDAVVAAKLALKSAQDAAATAQTNLKAKRDAFSTAPAVETFTDLDAQINSASKVATDIATFDQYDKVTKELHEARVESQVLTDKIEAGRKAREDALKAAEFPVEGLEIDHDGGVTFNSLPFDQECQSKRLRIAVALLATANPQLKWLAIRDGSCLDRKSRAALDELCKAFNVQCFIEVVESTDPAAIQIVDGTVAS